MSRRIKPKPPRVVKPKLRTVDGMVPPNHLCPKLVDLKKTTADDKVVSVFVRRHETFANAKKYYPHNPDGAMFACTWVNPFHLEKLLLAEEALKAEAASAIRSDRRARYNEASDQAVKRIIETMVTDIKQKLEELAPLLRDYAVTELVRLEQDRANRKSKP